MKGTMVQRSDYKGFYGLPGDSGATFARMKGFTDMSTSKNPIEYERQYVDEKHSTSDITGYSTSIGFTFDKYTDDEVLTDIADIIDNEKIGSEAQREIIMVDFTKQSGDGFEAIKRTFTVIGDSLGDSTEAMTYSGNFKVVSGLTKGVATIATPEGGSSDSVETITFAEVSE